jgi:hypothetical protein
MSRAHPFALVTACTALAVTALAAPRTTHAQTAAEITATAQRLTQEVPCVRAQHERLGSTLRLLEEAERQARSTTSGEAARRDAVHSAEALELRLGVIVGELRACLGQATPHTGTTHTASATSGATGTTGTTGTTAATSTTGTSTATTTPRVVVQHEGETTPHPAETANPATEVLESGRQLSRELFLVQAERVDGLGRADNNDVRQAVDRVAPQIAACYETLTAHSAHQRGRVYLTFTVTPEGRVRDIRLENFTIFDRTFQRCVGAAAGHLRVTQPATGGSARYSYHLRFGPPPDHGTPEVDY